MPTKVATLPPTDAADQRPPQTGFAFSSTWEHCYARQELRDLAERVDLVTLRAAIAMMEGPAAELAAKGPASQLPPGTKRMTEEELREMLEAGLEDVREGRTVSLEEATAQVLKRLGRA